MASKSRGIQTVNNQKEEKLNRENIIKKLHATEIRYGDLMYFRNKILSYEAEQQIFKEKLEKYMKIVDDRNALETELINKRDKIYALQNALSEMQKCLFEERERSNKLQSEVDMIKVQEEEYHQKLRNLLSMTADQNLRDNIVYVFNKPSGLQISQRLSSTSEEDQTKVKQVGSCEDEAGAPELVNTLQKQNEIIQDLLQRQKSLDQQKVEGMVKDCTISIKEAEKQAKEYSKKVKDLAEKLKATEADFKETYVELLNTKKMLHREEMLRGIQKASVLTNIEHAVNSISEDDSVNSAISKIIDNVRKALENFEIVDEAKYSGDTPENKSGEKNSFLKKEIHSQYLEHERENQDCQDHCAKIERELNECKDKKSTARKNQDYQKWLEEELDKSKAKLSKLESYRRLQMEGFQTDIKQLNKKVQDIEKYVLKTSLIIAKNDQDEELLKNIHSATKNSAHVSSEVQQLKIKLHQIQNALRFL